MRSLYSINDLSTKLCLSPSTIRKYEKDYNLEIMRNESNNRVYTDRDIEIFEKIINLKKEGANIHLIRKILANEGVIDNVPEVLEYKDLHSGSLEEFKMELVEQITKNVNKEFEKILDEKLHEQENKIREQIRAENQKLMNYIEEKREEKSSFWRKLFRKNNES